MNRRILSISIMMAFLAACQPQESFDEPLTDEPTIAAVPETAVPTIEIAPSVELATLTPTPEASPTLPPDVTPSPTPFHDVILSATHILQPTLVADFSIEALIFNDPADQGCQLPCWHGLRIGESTKEDIRRVATDLFGIGDRHLLFPDNLLESEYYEGYYNDRLYLESEDLSTAFLIDFRIGVENNRYEEFAMYFEPGLSLEVILERLGEPDFLILEADPYPTTQLELSITAIYQDKGTVFHQWLLVPANEADRTASLCLGQVPDLPRMTISHLDSPIDPADYLWQEASEPLMFEEVVELSLPDIIKRAVNEVNPCFNDIPLPHFYR